MKKGKKLLVFLMTFAMIFALLAFTDTSEAATIKAVPTVTVSAAQGATARKIVFTGKFAGYTASANYYTVTDHGIIYIRADQLGDDNLTMSTAGRVKVNSGSYSRDGSYSFTMAAKSTDTTYVAKAWLAYSDSAGVTVYSYSDAVKGSIRNGWKTLEGTGGTTGGDTGDTDSDTEIPSDCVELETYDANAGSSATYDCTSAFKQAIAAGTPVKLNEGKVYYIASAINVTKNFGIYGGKIKLKPSTTMWSAFTMTADDITFTMSGVEVYSENIYADKEHNDTVLSSNAFVVNSTNSATIVLQDCNFHDVASGAHIATTAKEFTVRNTTMTNMLTCIYSKAKGMHIYDSYFECDGASTLHHALYISSTTITEHVIKNSKFVNTNSSNPSTAQYYNSSSSMSGSATIRDCDFNGNFNDQYNNCTLYNCTVEGIANYNGSYYNCEINEIQMPSVYSKSMIFDGCTITGQVLVNKGTSLTIQNSTINYTDSTGTVIQLSNLSTFVLDNNVINSQSAKSVLYMSGVSSSTVTNNTVNAVNPNGITATNGNVINQL